jgi:hypothetical protein
MTPILSFYDVGMFFSKKQLKNGQKEDGFARLAKMEYEKK